MRRVTPGQTLRHRRWSGECVLYNDLSGDTHLLGEQAIDLLLALQANPSEIAEPDEDMLALLAELEALALIEAAAC
jgi:PqqD family protein of HPr-rel-A system